MQYLLEKPDTVLAKSVRFSTFVYCILSFSIVIITFGDSWMPLGIIVAGFLLNSLALLVTPFVVLFVSILLSSTLWRSVVFIIGLLMLTAEWLAMITFLSSHVWFSIMTSLPFIAIASYWSAVSLNAILRRPKRPAIAR